MTPGAESPHSPFVATIGRFARDHIDAAANDREGVLSPSLIARLAELGVFGVTIDERWGGSGLGLGGACAVVEELARHDRSVATTVGLHLGLGTRPLTAFGSPALQSLALPELAAGRAVAAFATTEPSAGSDLQALQTRVAACEGRLRLTGAKSFVTNGGFAGFITVAASSPGLGGAARGQSLVLLRGDDPGLVRGAEEHKLGLRASSTTGLYFDDLSLPADRIIGAPGKAADYLGHVLAWGRTVMAAGCNGTARAALDASISHAMSRRQFGRTLASMAVVRDQVAGMAAQLYAMRALVAHTAAMHDQEDALRRMSLAAKILCSESGGAICDTALQLHGGSGYIEDGGLPLLVRDARITRIFEGANDVLYTRLGAMEAAAPQQRPELGHGGADALADLVGGLRRAMTSEFGLQLIRRPRRLHQLGRAAALRAACDAAVETAQRDPDPNAHRLADHYVALAAIQVDQAAKPPRPLELVTGLTDALYDRCAS